MKNRFGIFLTNEEVKEFLLKINISKTELTFNFLEVFIKEILHRIPFQNFMMLERGFGHIPTEENIKEDMLSLKGGTCATMNSFAAAVLYKIGFNTELIHGTIMKENDHIAILLNYESEKYTIDIGDGKPYFFPHPTNKDLIYKHPFKTYRTINYNSSQKIDFLIKGEWKTNVILNIKPKTFKEIYKTIKEHYTKANFGPFWKGVRYAVYPNKEIFAIRDDMIISSSMGLMKKEKINNFDDLEKYTLKINTNHGPLIKKCYLITNIL